MPISWDELSEEDQQWYRQVNRAWARTLDGVTRGTLHMADGTDFQIPGGESGDYVDGVVRRFANWELKSINLDNAVSITILGETIELGNRQ